MNIGFIGLGIMGAPMAEHLIQAGHRLHVWARKPHKAEFILNQGATWADSPADLASQVEVLCLNVSDSRDVEALVLGDNGILAGAKPDLIVIDFSTISASTTRRMAELLATKAGHWVDAPVSGGQKGAQTASLTIMVGATPALFERVRPLLAQVGKTLTHVGDVGAGQITKACNQIVVSGTLAAIAEALLLAERAGVDPARVRAALLGGSAHSRMLEIHGARMLSGDFTPGFKAKLHQKDLSIVRQTAEELGLALPGASLAAQWMNALVGAGGGELDSAALITVLRQLNGLSGGD
jgi:2-hydroxy-3-oxopropionate reductase